MHAARLLREQLERGQRARDRGRRRGGREDERARGVRQQVRELGVAGGERAVGAQRLAERADDDVDLALEAGLGDRAAAALADAARRVRLVDDDAHVVVAGELADLLERRDVAVHREDGLRHDERRARPGLREPPGEVLDVVVAVDEHLGARQAAAVDDRGVVELVREDDLARARQRADDAEVREVARPEQQRASPCP